ncbi:MAG: ATP-binding protein, partial [Candidatus Brocadiaceae bacterium]|nr:ATP-binding protein [Candidatus Brocadiaceae bacterium]
PCGIISIDSNNTVNTFNKSSAKMLKISPQDILGKDVKYIGSVFANILLRTLKDKKIYEMSQVEDRSTRSTYSISTSLLVNNGKELGSIMVFSDLSGMKKLESRIKVLEKQAFYKMLGKNMAHYMENHLVAVKTFMDLFPHKLETLYDAKEFIGKFFPVAQEELSNLDLLIKKLITLGENENLMKKSLDLKVPLDRALDVCKGEIKRLKIHIKKHYTEEPAIIFGNYEKLEEVFSTIIINAIEAMQESGTLTVKLSRVLLDGKKMKEALPFLNDEERSVAYCGQKAQKESPRDFLEVLIQDDGCGLPPGEVENIFLPFYTTKEHNIGLGLSIAQRLVEEFNGFISVSAIEKKGSSFYVLLPSLNVS